MKSGSVSITGATGFVGWHLAEGFQHAGWRVRAVVRPGGVKPVPDGVERIEAALNTDTLAAVIAEGEVVVHAAGLTRSLDPRAFDFNVSGTRAVVEAANRRNARLMLISSQAAIGPGTIGRPSREDDEPRPLTPYGRSKLAGEAEVRARAQSPWVILRPTTVYGPRDRQFLPLFRMASRGIFLRVTPPEMAFSFIFIDDLTRAVVSAGERIDDLAETAMFLGHPDPVTAAGILQGLASVFERRYRPWTVPRFVLDAFAWGGELTWRFGEEPLLDRSRLTELRSEGFVCAVDRVRERLGFTAAVPLQEGLARTARWYRQQGWI
jgi:nucleoside-diphosphate-sugar epimerase